MEYKILISLIFSSKNVKASAVLTSFFTKLTLLRVLSDKIWSSSSATGYSRFCRQSRITVGIKSGTRSLFELAVHRKETRKINSSGIQGLA